MTTPPASTSNLTPMSAGSIAPVRKTIRVRASVDHAFDVFTAGIDRWWPREHHIGTSPMTRIIVEPRVGGRCYSEQQDGTECDWGSVLAWEPPRRVVLAWQIKTNWTFEPELTRSSEVEIRFTPEPGGITRVDLEHGHLERHGPDADKMRAGVDNPNGWTGTLARFAAEVER
jgi:uncharacterized protein YndB with AHSA1/START domain